MTKPEFYDELLELLGKHCNEGLSEAEADRVNTMLSDNRGARQVYAEYMMIHSELFWQESSPARDLPTVESVVAPSHRVGWLDARIVALAATLLIGVAIGSWGIGRFRNASNGTASRPINKRIVVAQVTGTRNCRWSSEGQAGEDIGYGSDLFQDQRLELIEGLAEITFDCGARIILEAPAKLDLASQKRSVLHRGRLTASVPSRAAGFEVKMDRLTIVDLGTEFGVSSVDGSTEVQVFDGFVEGHFFDEHGEKIRKVSWKADETVRVNPNSADFVYATSTSRFVRSLGPTNQQELHAQDDFDYPVGPLGGQNGGFGWGGPWVDISADGSASSTNTISAGSLRIDGVVQAGNHASLVAQRNRIRRVLSTSLGGVFDSMRLVEDQDGLRLIGADQRSVYLSFSQRVSAESETFYGLELHRGDGNSNRVMCIGNAGDVAGYGVTSEVNGGTRTTFQPLGGEPTEKAAFFVVRFDFGSNNADRITIYRDPESNLNEGKCTVDATMIGNFAFDRVSIGNFDGDKVVGIDRIRLGTSFAAVTDDLLSPPRQRDSDSLIASAGHY